MTLGNIGIVTTIDARLCEITGIRDGLIYCITLESPKITRICLPWHFWVLLDSL